MNSSGKPTAGHDTRHLRTMLAATGRLIDGQRVARLVIVTVRLTGTHNTLSVLTTTAANEEARRIPLPKRLGSAGERREQSPGRKRTSVLAKRQRMICFKYRRPYV